MANLEDVLKQWGHGTDPVEFQSPLLLEGYLHFRTTPDSGSTYHEGLKIAGSIDYFGAGDDATILDILDSAGSGGVVDHGLIIAGYTTGDSQRKELLRITDSEFEWQSNEIWHAGNLTINDLSGVPSSRTLTAGAGLTGGGTLSADRTFNVGAGDGITVNADSVQVDSTVVRTGSVDQSISGQKTFSNTVQVGTGDLQSTRVTNLGQMILINNVNDPYVDFRDALAGNSVQLLSDPSAGTLSRKVTAGTYEIWDEGNDGSGSGMDSDLLDGLHASQFIRSDIYSTASGSVNFTDTSGFILGFDAGVYQITVHDGQGNFNIKANVDVDEEYVVSGESAGKLHLYTQGDGFEFSVFGHNGTSTTAGAVVSYDWAWRFNENGLYRSTNPGSGGGVSNALPAIGNDGRMYPDGGTMTSGRVPYVHSSGYLTSDSGLAYSGSTLTATNLAGAGAGITGVVHTTGNETVAGIKTFSGNNIFTGINTIQSNQPELRWLENDTTDTNWKVIVASGQFLFQTMNDAGSTITSRVRLYQDGGFRLGATDGSPGTNSLQVDGTMYGNYLRLTEVGDASLSSTTHPLQLGSTGGFNLIADANEIMARNNGAASTLYLNLQGGQIQLGGDVVLANDNTIVPATNDAGSIGSASKYWSTGYFTTLYVDTLDVGTVDIGTFSDESILFANASGDIDEDAGVFVYDDANQQLEVPFIRASVTVNETGGTQYPISSFVEHNATNETINAGKHNFYANFNKTGSGTYTSYTATGYWHQAAIDAGQIQNLFGFNSRMQVEQGATVVDMIHFQADTAYNSSYVGTVNTRTGFRFRNYNKDVSFTTQYGFKFDNQVYGDSLRAFYSDQNSGSDKYNLYFDGTAKSWSKGQLILGDQGASETSTEELVISHNSGGAGIRVRSTGDASLTLEADTGSGSEDNNPYIHFLQDGASVQAWIGHFGNANTSPLGSTIDGINGNAFGVVNINGQIMLGAGNKKTYTAVGDGTTEIFATNTRIHAHPDSENETVYLDLASQWSDTRNADTMIRLYGQETGAWSNLLQIKMQTDSAILNLNNTTGNIAMQLQGTNRVLVTPTYVEVNHPLRADSLIVNGSSALHNEIATVHGGFAISIGEGLEFAGDNDYFGAASDARIIRALDTNGSAGAVDGGIVFGGYTTSDDVFVEWLRMRNSVFEWQGNTIWHAGNDGSGSGLDADTLDGVQGSGYVNTTSAQTVAGQKTFTSSPVIEHAQPAIYFDESDYSSVVWSPRQATGDFYIAQLDGSFAFVKNVFIIKEEASSGLMTLDNGIVDIAGVIELNDPVDVNLTSTGNAIQIGAYGSPNLVFDSNEMQARNNGAASAFNINILGGDVTIGASGTTTTLNATAISIPNGLLSLGGVSDTTTAPTKVAVETGNDNIVRWQAPDVFANNLNVRNRYYKLPNTSASAQWVKIGTFTAPQAGQALKIDMVLHSGYNAANSQDFNVKVFFKASNATSTDANGFAGNAWHYVVGNNASDLEPTWVGNASGTSATAFDLYMYLPVFTLNSFYNVYFSDDATSWVHAGSLGQSDPGSGSATVCVSESVVDFKADSVKANGYQIWTSGNDGAGSGLEADYLDGFHASSFVQLTGAQSVAGVKTLTNNLQLESTQPALLFSETDTTDDNFKFILSSSSFYLQEMDNAFGNTSTIMRWYHGGGLVIGSSGSDPGDNNVHVSGSIRAGDELYLNGATPEIQWQETDGSANEDFRIAMSNGELWMQTGSAGTSWSTRTRFHQSGGVSFGVASDPGTNNILVGGDIQVDGFNNNRMLVSSGGAIAERDEFPDGRIPFANSGSPGNLTSNADFAWEGFLKLGDTSGKVIEFDAGGAMITVHDGFGNFNIKAGVDETHTVTDGAGGSHIEMDDGGFIQLSVTTAAESASFTDDYYLKVDGTVGYNSSRGDFLPSADSTYDLGANSVRWAYGYFDDLVMSNITASNLVRLTNTNDVTLASTNHPFQIGSDASSNVAFDNNEIQARDNGAAAQLNINVLGGTVVIGNSGLSVGSSLVTVNQTMRLADNARFQLDDAGTTDQNYSIENSSGIFRIAKVNDAYSGYTPLLYLNEDGGMSLGNGLTSDTPAGDLHAAGEVFANQKFMAVVEKYKSVTTVQHWKIAEIPASDTSTGDYLVIEFMGGRYDAPNKATSRICFSNRQSFVSEYYAYGQINDYTGIRVYNNSGVREVYLYLSAEQYCHGAAVCYATGWGSTRIELFPDPTNVGTTPTGTLEFDSTTDTPDAHIPGTGSGSTFDADLLDGQHGAYYLAWANFTGVPSTFTPSSHTHVIGDTTGLQAALDSKLASSSYTAADVLTKIKTVDGSGTGLDADLIDGVQLSDLVQQSLTGLGRTGNQSSDSTTDTAAEWSNLPVGYSKMINIGVGIAGGAPRDNHGYFTKIANRDTGGGWSGLWLDYNTDRMFFGSAATSSVTATWTEIWTEANDGSGSGLDADTVDGLQASALVQLAGSQTITGSKIFSANPAIQGTQPTLFLMESDVTNKNWKILVAEGNLSIQTVTDAYAFDKHYMRIFDNGGVAIGATPVDPGLNSLYVQGVTRLTGALSLQAATPDLRFVETDATADQNWRMAMSNGNLLWQTMNDAGSALSTVSALYQSGGWFFGTTATDPGSNNIIVRGDVMSYQDFTLSAGSGKGLRFWNSDSYSIYMSQETEANIGGDLSGDSDYNMYFRMASGTNRGFVFKNNTTPVAQIDASGRFYSASGGGIRLESTTMNLSSTDHAFQLGATVGNNLRMDGNKIQAVSNGGGQTLLLNSFGGDLQIGENAYIRNTGALRLGSPDLAESMLHVVGQARIDNLTEDTLMSQQGGHFVFEPGTEDRDMWVSILSTWGSTRTYDARLRLYGAEAGNWNNHFEFLTNGGDCYIDANNGDLFVQRASTTMLHLQSNVVEVTDGKLLLTDLNSGKALHSQHTATNVDATWHLESGGKAILILEADTNSGAEDNVPYIRFSQDAGGVTGFLGLQGQNNNPLDIAITGADTNGMMLGTDTNYAVQFVQNNTMVMKLDSSRVVTYRDIDPDSAGTRAIGNDTSYYASVHTEAVRLNGENKLEFDEDSALGGMTTNVTFLSSVADLVLGCNSNNNGTGDLKFGHGHTTPGGATWDTLMHIRNDGRASLGFESPSLDFELIGEMRIRNAEAHPNSGIYFGTHGAASNDYSQMIHFSDRNSNAYGHSIIAAGQADPVFDGVTFSDVEDAYMYIIRHNTSTEGAIQMSFARAFDSVGFGNAQPNTSYQISSTIQDSGNVGSNLALRNIASPVIGQGASLNFTSRSNTSNSNEAVMGRLFSTMTKLGSSDYESDVRLSVADAGAENEIMRWSHTGAQIFYETTKNPTAEELTTDSYSNPKNRLAVYMKNDKLVFAYNNSGTVTYITLDLNGSDTTLSHSTTAP